MQVFKKHVFTYNNIGKGIVVPYDKDPEADDCVLNNVEFVLGEKGPTHVHDEKRLLRAIGNIIQEFDVESEKFMQPTKMLKNGEDLDCFSHSPNMFQAIGERRLIIKDSRESNGIHEDVIEHADKSINCEWMRDIEGCDLIATVCMRDYVLNVVWLLRNKNKRVLSRLRSIELQTLPGNYFNMLTDFQAERHGNYVVLTATGHKCTSKVRVQTPADKNRDSAFVAAMLYDIGKVSEPTLIAKIKCVPPQGDKKGSPDVNPSFPVRFWSDNGKVKVRIYAKWSVDKHLVSWNVDVEKLTRDSLVTGQPLCIENLGGHVQSDRSQGLNFDHTISIKASSMDPYSSAGFVSTNGRHQVFTISENPVTPSEVLDALKTSDALGAGEIVKTFKDANVLQQEFDNICIQDDRGKREITLASILYNTAKNYVFGDS